MIWQSNSVFQNALDFIFVGFIVIRSCVWLRRRSDRVRMRTGETERLTIRMKKGNVDGVVFAEGGWELELVCIGVNDFGDFEGAEPTIAELF